MSRFIGWPSSAAITFLALPLGLRADRAYRALPRLTVAPQQGPLPSLSVIVPARNEAANLGVLLPSLAALRYPGRYEVIVVDDGSADGTAAVAAGFGARVVPAGALRSGWLGKPHACHQGAQAAGGEWLLFTDADTVHAPDGPAGAVAYAASQGLDGLSLHLELRCRNWLERVALAAAYAGLFAGLPRDSAMLNGQYILLRRDVYLRSGGFAMVRGEMLEDVALGHHLRRLGYRVPMLRGEAAAAVSMYGDASQMWNGLARLGSGALRWAGPGGLLTALSVTAAMSPLVATAGVLSGRLRRRWLLPTWAAVAVGTAPWVRRFGSPALSLLVPIGALVVQIAALWGLIARLLGRGVRWKGRHV